MNDLGQFPGAVADRVQGGKEIGTHALRFAEAGAMNNAGIPA